MLCRMFLLSLFAGLFFASSTNGFVVNRPRVSSGSLLQARKATPALQEKLVQVATTAAITLSSSPLIALAEEDYEYGAVDAPIGLAWGAGVLAILTALLPIALQGGEEAFEDMKERDKESFGSSKSTDVLKSRKK